MLVLFLGLFFALGTILSTVQASDMSVKMAMSSEWDTSGDTGCMTCGGDGDQGSTNSHACPPVCTLSAALFPPDVSLEAPHLKFTSLPSGNLSRHGCTFSPDPHPPKDIAIS
jgi:hypothetical protein